MNRLKKIKKVYWVILLCAVLAVGISISYAFFTAEFSIVANEDVDVVTGELDINVSDSSLTVSNLKPIYDTNYLTEADSHTFNIINESTSTEGCAKIYLNISSISDSLKSEYFKWALSDGTSIVANGDFTQINSDNRIPLYAKTMSIDDTDNYTIYIWIAYDDVVDQMDMLNTSLTANIYVEGYASVGYVCSISYKVNFYNYDGTLHETKNVNAGTTAEPSTLPVKDSGNYTYAFSKWVTTLNGSIEAELTNISSDMNVYASFTNTKLKIFYINGERCTFLDKIGSDTNSTWGYYIDYCSNVSSTITEANGKCPNNNRLLSYDTKIYLNDNSTQLYNENFANIIPNSAIEAGVQYGDYNYIDEYNLNNCFVTGTKVYSQKGLVNIQDIKIGDRVWSYNEKTKQNELSEVTNLIKKTTNKIYKLNINNEIIETTENHPFYINNQWIKVKNLKVNDKLTSFNGNNLNLNNIQIVNKEKTNVYNLTVNNNHTYYVGINKILVHNKPT